MDNLPQSEHQDEEYAPEERCLITYRNVPLRFVKTGITSLSGEIRAIGDVFWENLFAAFSAASTPQIMAYGIAKQKLGKDTPRDDIAADVPAVLAAYLKLDGFRTVAISTLRQSLVATWTTLEVLASDVFVEVVNHKPSLAQRLVEDSRGQKLYQYTLKSLVSSLHEYGFDLSRHMGDFLLRQRPLDDVETMRIAFDILFPDGDELRTMLHDQQLWRVYKVRNLIVHRGAVVDEAFRRTSGVDAEIGQPIYIKASTLLEFMVFVGKLGLELLKTAQKSQED